MPLLPNTVKIMSPWQPNTFWLALDREINRPVAHGTSPELCYVAGSASRTSTGMLCTRSGKMQLSDLLPTKSVCSVRNLPQIMQASVSHRNFSG